MKDIQVHEYTIKIEKIRSVKKVAGGLEYRDKMFLVDIGDGIRHHTMFSVPANENYGASLRKVLKKIQQELYLTKL